MIFIIATDAVLDQAYHWLCKAREKYSPNSDVWDLRFHWEERKPIIQKQLLAGTYTLSPMVRVEINGEVRTFWEATDALVLKAVALTLTKELAPRLSAHCYHLPGKGLKAAVRATQEAIDDYQFVFRSDIDSYYASIDHGVLMELLGEFIADPITLGLIRQSMERTETMGGVFWDFDVGIPMGSPLSPILGAVALLPLDRALTRAGCFYARFMDDWVLLAKTRNQLRTAVKTANKLLASLKQSKHPRKTFIGRIEKGFDFLGYHFKGGLLEPAAATLQRFFTKLTQLYEQHDRRDLSAVAGYVKRWIRWLIPKAWDRRWLVTRTSERTWTLLAADPILLGVLYPAVALHIYYLRPAPYSVG